MLGVVPLGGVGVIHINVLAGSCLGPATKDGGLDVHKRKRN